MMNNSNNNNAFTQLTLLPVNGSINITDHNQMNHNNNNNLSMTLQAQLRHNLVSTVSKQAENVQKILQCYNSDFSVSIQSLTNSINNTNTNSNNQLINDVQTVINLQDKLWKDLTQQKNVTDSELQNIKHTLINVVAQQQQQQQVILINQQTGMNNFITTSQNINNLMNLSKQTQQAQQPTILVVGNNNINNHQMVQLAVNDMNNQGQGRINIPSNPNIPSVNDMVIANNHPSLLFNHSNHGQVDTADRNLSQLLNNVNNVSNSNIINSSSCTGTSPRRSNMHANNILNVNNPFIVNSNNNPNTNNSNPAHNSTTNSSHINNINSSTNEIDRELAKILAQHSFPVIDNNSNNLNAFDGNNNINDLVDISPSNDTNSNINGNISNNRKKRKRRGYNGPYSEEEKNFMKDFNRNKTTEDIIALSIEMENKFKVKRSPYGLAQKMYQMGIINSRLKAIFQRQFQNEGNINHSDDSSDNNNNSNNGLLAYNNVYHSHESKESNLNMNTNTKATSPSTINSNNSSNGSSIAINKRRPFTSQELNYLNQLINDYNNEQPRKLFWRFAQKFKNWNEPTKSYQKFYHKYWTLTNEKRTTTSKQAKNLKQEVDDDDTSISSNDINHNNNHQRRQSKRKISLPALNNHPKRMKLN